LAPDRCLHGRLPERRIRAGDPPQDPSDGVLVFRCFGESRPSSAPSSEVTRPLSVLIALVAPPILARLSRAGALIPVSVARCRRGECRSGRAASGGRKNRRAGVRRPLP